MTGSERAKRASGCEHRSDLRRRSRGAGPSLEETSLGFYRAWHVAVGAKHGLLLALRDAPLDADTLAAELGLDARATRDWCEGAWALGLLRKGRGRYRLAREHAETLGEPASPRYMGHHLEYVAAKSLGFAALDERMRGKLATPTLATTYALATRWDHLAFFELLLPKERALAQALAGGIDVLDLGAGAGGWTREAIRRYPLSRYHAADLDLAPLAGLRALHPGDVPANVYDLVFLGEVLASAQDPADVLRTAHRALRPGGRVVALEGLAPERAPRSWGEKLVLAMQLDFGLDGSRYLSPKQARAAFRSGGFPRATISDLGGSLFAMRARKPQTSRAA